MDSPLWIYLLGFAGMAIYGSRILIQWYMSEKSHQVESPGIYWILSSIGAVVLYIYGWLRKDLPIIVGESLGYYVYMWNISVMGLYKKVPRVVVVLQALFPLVILALIVRDWHCFVGTFLKNEFVPPGLLAYGILGQVTFEIRSLYQLIYSYRRKRSILPLGHWVLAVVGSVMIISYGVIRHDWVLALGQFSIFFSIRNLMISIASRKWKHTASQVLMVRPVNFGFNSQTAGSNRFQHKVEPTGLQEAALAEFDAMVEKLRQNGITVTVAEDVPGSQTPDSIFPNNWFSTHPDGTLVLYPMFAPNRRLERRPEIIRAIKDAAVTRRVVDLSGWEQKGKFLEGTGSLVLDRASRTAYACRSPRTSETVLGEFCRQMGYQAVIFDALDPGGMPIYHTNVLMSVGEDYALVCKDVFVSPEEYGTVESRLAASGKRTILISFEQMMHYAGNILQLHSCGGERLIVMSDTALDCLDAGQKASLERSGRILAVHIPHIEEAGGGSARCMLAEIFPRS